MITDVQCRMARAALRWSVRDLAQRAGIGYGTVVRFEGGKPANSATLQVILRAFEAGALVFIDADETAGEGVRLKAPAKDEKPAEEPAKLKNAKAARESEAEARVVRDEKRIKTLEKRTEA